MQKKEMLTAKRKTRDENCQQMNDKIIIVVFVVAVLLAIICFPLTLNTHTHFSTPIACYRVAESPKSRTWPFLRITKTQSQRAEEPKHRSTNWNRCMS